MDTQTRVQIPARTVCISHIVNILGKGTNQNILPTATGKIVGQSVLFNLSMATGLEEGKL